MSIEPLKDAFNYDPKTGIVTWKSCRKSHLGKPVGTPTPKGYLRCRFKGKGIMIHRLAWILYYGEEPAAFIDHRNRIRNDNRIENLRLASLFENARNAKLRSDNSCGAKGVSWVKRSKKWGARINVDGKTIYLGYFSTASEAAEAYRVASLKYHGEFSAMASEPSHWMISTAVEWPRAEVGE